MPRSNLLSLFDDFHRYSRDIAVVQRRGYRRESSTYAKLAKIAFRLEHDLRQHGVRTGDRVLLWSPNSAEWMAAFWGCLLRGAVAVPIDDGATFDFAARVARETSAKLIIASEGKPSLDAAIPTLNLEDLADRSKEPYVVITHHDGRHTPPPIHQSLADEHITRNHVAQILFTSGTTAEPRGVVLTHGNFLANLEPLERGIDPHRKYERWWHPLRFVSLVPLSHVFGQFMTLFVPPLLGATVVFEPSPNAAEVIRTVKRKRMVRTHLRSRLWPKVSSSRLDVPPHSSPLRMEILGLHLRWRGALRRNRGVFQAHRLRGSARVRDDGDSFAYQPQPSVSRRARLDR